MFTRFRNTLCALLLAGLTTSACQSWVGTAVTPSVSSAPTLDPTTTATSAPIPSLSPAPEATALDPITAVPALSPIPEAVWTHSTDGAIWGTPTYSEGVVYFGSDDGNLYSLDAQDGTLIWSFQTQGIVRSRPAIAGDLVYFASDDGYLYAVQKHSGAQIWRTDIGNSLPRNKREKLGTSTEPTGWDYKQSSPVVADGYVFIGSLDGNVYALTAETGTIQWTFLTGQKVRATPTLVNNTLYIGSWDKSVYALNAQTGQIIWKTPVGGEVQSTALVVDGLVYTASRKASVVALDAQTGQLKWEHDYSTNMWVESSPILMGNTIYIGSSGKQPILGLDPETGNTTSAFFTKAFNLSTPFILNNMLYIGAISYKQDKNKGGLIGLQLDGNKFSNAIQEDWYFPVLERETAEGNWSGVVSSPVANDGVVYFGGLDGKFYAVAVETPSDTPLATPIHTAISNSVVPSATVSAPEIFWTFDTGKSVWSSPAVHEGFIYFGSDDGNLYAVDIRKGTLRWKFSTGGFVRSRPAIADGTVYFTSDDGYLYALRSDSGEERWRADLGEGKMPVRGESVTKPWDYQQSSPVVADEKVYVGSGNQGLYAFDTDSGVLLWKFATVGRVRNTPAIADGLVFIGDQLALLHAVDAETGIEKWQSQGCDIPTPLVYNGLVYCGSRLFKDLRAWEAKTGELRWKFSFQGSWVESSPSIANDTLYIGSSDVTALFAIDPYSGELMWSFSTGAFPWSTPAIENGVVYIGDFSPSKSTGNFYAVDAGTGQLLWSMPVPIGVVSSPQEVDGVVYFGGLDGKLYAVQTIP